MFDFNDMNDMEVESICLSAFREMQKVLEKYGLNCYVDDGGRVAFFPNVDAGEPCHPRIRIGLHYGYFLRPNFIHGDS